MTWFRYFVCRWSGCRWTWATNDRWGLPILCCARCGRRNPDEPYGGVRATERQETPCKD